MLPRLDTLLYYHQKTLFISEKHLNKNVDVDIERMSFFVHLPSTVKEVLALEKGPQVAHWKEFKSSSPAHKFCPELPPVFVLPPLKSGQMDSIIKSIFHPTFVAVIPQDIQHFYEMACQLHKDLEKFNTGVFTLICSDWSWPVGIFLGKLLEKNGKEVSIIFFESSITWESETAYKQIVNEVKRDSVYNSLSQEEKEHQSVKIHKALHKLKHLLHLFGSELPPKSPKIKGICHYIRHNEMLRNEGVSKLQEYCDQTINVFTSEKSDYLSMMRDKKVIHHINSCILFEYKDAATKIEKIYLKEGIYNNPRLSYLSFMQSYHFNKQSGNKNPLNIKSDF